MGVSPISLKKNRCSRHFRPMERSAGSRRRSFANLDDGGENEKDSRVRNDEQCELKRIQRKICGNIILRLLLECILGNAEM